MDNKLIMGLTLIASMILAGITYEVYDTDNEITCRTNKPDGWDIVNDYGAFVESVCPYKTKDPIYANCSSFRSTATYERYGCNEVIVVAQESQEEPADVIIREPNTDNRAKRVTCDSNGCTEV